jgi:uncharacterized membrane protein YbhN (UPF0104 family)
VKPPPESDKVPCKRSTTSNKWLLTAVKILVSTSLLAWFFATQKIDWQELTRLLGDTDFFFLSLAAITWILLLALGGWRWWILLGVVGVKAGLWPCVRYTLAAVFFSTISFGPLAADGVRAWWAARHFEARLVPAILSLVADRLTGLFALGIVCLCLFPTQWDVLMSRADTASVLLVVVFILSGSVAAVLFSVLMRSRPGAPPNRWLNWLPFAEKRREISAAVDACLKQPRPFFSSLLISIMIQILSVLSGVLTLLSLKIDFPLLYGASLVPMVNLLQALPVTIMGFGVRESTVAVLFSHISETAEPALAFAMLNFVINLVGAAVGLLIWLIMRQKNTPKNTFSIN